MDKIRIIGVKRNLLLVTISVVLAISLCLTNIFILCGITAIFNPFGLGENFVLPAIIFMSLAANEVYINLKYNEQWIKSHSKEEIIKRYGEFDACWHSDCYYKTLEISSTSFEAIKISFNEDGTVREIDKNSRYSSPGG